MKIEKGKVYMVYSGFQYYSVEVISEEKKSIFGNYFYCKYIYKDSYGRRRYDFGKIRKRNFIVLL